MLSIVASWLLADAPASKNFGMEERRLLTESGHIENTEPSPPRDADNRSDAKNDFANDEIRVEYVDWQHKLSISRATMDKVDILLLKIAPPKLTYEQNISSRNIILEKRNFDKQVAQMYTRHLWARDTAAFSEALVDCDASQRENVAFRQYALLSSVTECGLLNAQRYQLLRARFIHLYMSPQYGRYSKDSAIFRRLIYQSTNSKSTELALFGNASKTKADAATEAKLSVTLALGRIFVASAPGVIPENLAVGLKIANLSLSLDRNYGDLWLNYLKGLAEYKATIAAVVNIISSKDTDDMNSDAYTDYIFDRVSSALTKQVARKDEHSIGAPSFLLDKRFHKAFEVCLTATRDVFNSLTRLVGITRYIDSIAQNSIVGNGAVYGVRIEPMGAFEDVPPIAHSLAVFDFVTCMLRLRSHLTTDNSVSQTPRNSANSRSRARVASSMDEAADSEPIDKQIATLRETLTSRDILTNKRSANLVIVQQIEDNYDSLVLETAHLPQMFAISQLESYANIDNRTHVSVIATVDGKAQQEILLPLSQCVQVTNQDASGIILGTPMRGGKNTIAGPGGSAVFNVLCKSLAPKISLRVRIGKHRVWHTTHDDCFIPVVYGTTSSTVDISSPTLDATMGYALKVEALQQPKDAEKQHDVVYGDNLGVDKMDKAVVLESRRPDSKKPGSSATDEAASALPMAAEQRGRLYDPNMGDATGFMTAAGRSKDGGEFSSHGAQSLLEYYKLNFLDQNNDYSIVNFIDMVRLLRPPELLSFQPHSQRPLDANHKPPIAKPHTSTSISREARIANIYRELSQKLLPRGPINELLFLPQFMASMKKVDEIYSQKVGASPKSLLVANTKVGVREAAEHAKVRRVYGNARHANPHISDMQDPNQNSSDNLSDSSHNKNPKAEDAIPNEEDVFAELGLASVHAERMVLNSVLCMSDAAFYILNTGIPSNEKKEITSYDVGQMQTALAPSTKNHIGIFWRMGEVGSLRQIFDTLGRFIKGRPLYPARYNMQKAGQHLLRKAMLHKDVLQDRITSNQFINLVVRVNKIYNLFDTTSIGTGTSYFVAGVLSGSGCETVRTSSYIIRAKQSHGSAEDSDDEEVALLDLGEDRFKVNSLAINESMTFRVPLPALENADTHEFLGFDRSPDSLASLPYSLKLLIYEEEPVVHGSIALVAAASIPVSTVYHQGLIESEFVFDQNFCVCGYGYSDSVPESQSPESFSGTMRPVVASLILTFDPPLRPTEYAIAQIRMSSVDPEDCQLSSELYSAVQIATRACASLHTSNEALGCIYHRDYDILYRDIELLHSATGSAVNRSERQRISSMRRLGPAVPHDVRFVSFFAHSLNGASRILCDFVASDDVVIHILDRLKVTAAGDCIRLVASIPYVPSLVSHFYTQTNISDDEPAAPDGAKADTRGRGAVFSASSHIGAQVGEVRLDFEQMSVLAGGDCFEHACFLCGALNAIGEKTYVARVATNMETISYCVVLLKDVFDPVAEQEVANDEDATGPRSIRSRILSNMRKFVQKLRHKKVDYRELVREQSITAYLINPVSGISYVATQAASPYVIVSCMFNRAEFLINIQEEMRPGLMFWDLSNRRYWHSFKASLPSFTKLSINLDELYSPAEMSVAEDLQRRLSFLVTDTLREWRIGAPTHINNRVNEALQRYLVEYDEILRTQLPNNMYLCSKFAEKIQVAIPDDITKLFTIVCDVVKDAWTDAATLLEKVKHTAVYTTSNRRSEFSVAVYVAPWTTRFANVYIGIARLDPIDFTQSNKRTDYADQKYDHGW